MKIAVIGATRGIGLEVVKQALEDDHDVTALVRDPDRMPVRHPRLHLVQGDARDPESVATAVHGQDVVCDCLGTKNVFARTVLFSTCAQNLARALRPEQLLIAVTGIGTGDSRGHGTFLYDHVVLPLVLGRIYADKERQERIIRDHIERWIIVRPGILTNGPRTGRYRALVDLHGVRGGRISRADVADFVLSQAKSPTFIGKTPLLIS
ncbi:SDR family oxidoreductase [Symbiobacterium thermophilum]|uniref:SDR family oxidoreductase n=1 Tax=Symbiobacterium thermophilum TaxID=2734 RepID=UPI0035C6DBEF